MDHNKFETVAVRVEALHPLTTDEAGAEGTLSGTAVTVEDADVHPETV